MYVCTYVRTYVCACLRVCVCVCVPRGVQATKLSNAKDKPKECILYMDGSSLYRKTDRVFKKNMMLPIGVMQRCTSKLEKGDDGNPSGRVVVVNPDRDFKFDLTVDDAVAIHTIMEFYSHDVVTNV
eukprot:GHVU01193467.1.p2 GENE.GHVU01193467.1~~GHVU01193467.1.p2  ORF type:complete len:126 (+),score=20.10 GHVU01193467.1:342-719(+)